MKSLKSIALILAIATLQLVFPDAALGQQRYGRPTVSTSVSTSGRDLTHASQREKERERQKQQKLKQKEKQQKAKAKAQQQKAKEKAKQQKAKERAKQQKGKQQKAHATSSTQQRAAAAEQPTAKRDESKATKAENKSAQDRKKANRQSKSQNGKDKGKDNKKAQNGKNGKTAKADNQAPSVTPATTGHNAPQKTAHTKAEKAEEEQFDWLPQQIIAFGPKGGLASFLPQNGKWPASRPGNMGYIGAFDIDYTYTAMNHRQFGIGVHTGLTVGYTSNRQSVYLLEQFPYTDVLGNEIDYRITADNVTERNSELVVSIPVQLALRYKGFYANLGVRAQLPLMQKFTQTITDVSVDAYYKQYDVHVVDKPATGLLAKADYNMQGDWQGSKVDILLSGELGYYIPVGEKLVVGLGLFADYSVWSLYSNERLGRVFSVSGVGEGPQTAVVRAATLNSAYTNSLGFFDVGAKISFGVKL